MKILEVIIDLRLEVRMGWRFLWNCFGESAFVIELGPYSTIASIVYDINTQEVYSMSFYDESDEPLISYMWVNPNYRDVYSEEREEKMKRMSNKEVDISSFEVIVSKHKKICEEVLTSE